MCMFDLLEKGITSLGGLYSGCLFRPVAVQHYVSQFFIIIRKIAEPFRMSLKIIIALKNRNSEMYGHLLERK